MENTHFLVRRDRLAEHKLATSERGALAAGEVELAIDRFGFTTNNVTYGALGDVFSYWQFFPAAEPGWGRIPVWGFGAVTRSTVDEVAVGERFYGYFPMSTHLVVRPERHDAAGFLDGTPHRRELSGAYNQYLRTRNDPNYRADTEAQQVILRPLFATSFLLADFLEESRFFDAELILVSSASSKTAYGMAFVLGEARRRGGRELVGLTSERNRAFVAGLGLYDRVLSYAELATLPSARPAVYIDVAGNRSLRAAVHEHFGAALKHTSAVGAAHRHDLMRGEARLPGPQPVLFFAPARVKQRSAEWTPAGLQQRLAAAWNAFLVPLLDPARGWMSIREGRGVEAVAQAYDEVVADRGSARDGFVLSLS